jgi:dihydroorotase
MNSNRYVLKGGKILGNAQSDLLIANGVIENISPTITDDSAITIDVTGSVILPGLVDLHTHLREPGREDSETVLSASKAAAKGGFTALSAMANTSPVADTAGVVEQVFRLGHEAGLVDVFPIGAVTQGLKGEQLSEIGAMADSPVSYTHLTLPTKLL